MTKDELYENLEIFSRKDMILVNDEVIVTNEDLDDDWFELSDFAGNEDIGKEFYFNLVTHVDFKDNFEKFENSENIYETTFRQPLGCVVRFEVNNIIEKQP